MIYISPIIAPLQNHLKRQRVYEITIMDESEGCQMASLCLNVVVSSKSGRHWFVHKSIFTNPWLCLFYVHMKFRKLKILNLGSALVKHVLMWNFVFISDNMIGYLGHLEAIKYCQVMIIFKALLVLKGFPSVFLLVNFSHYILRLFSSSFKSTSGKWLPIFFTERFGFGLLRP